MDTENRIIDDVTILMLSAHGNTYNEKHTQMRALMVTLDACVLARLLCEENYEVGKGMLISPLFFPESISAVFQVEAGSLSNRA